LVNLKVENDTNRDCMTIRKEQGRRKETHPLLRNLLGNPNFVETKACLSRSCGLESSGQVNPDSLVQFCLDEGAAEIDRARVPVEHERQYQEESNRGPADHWGVGVKHAFFEVSSGNGAAFVRLDGSVRGSFSFEDPLGWEDPGGCLRTVHLGPGVFSLSPGLK
jgi:hypothetical protein